MIYLFWALLNFYLFIFFLRICVKATSLVKEKVGLFSSVIFVFGLLFIGCSNSEIPIQKVWRLNSKDSLNNNQSSFSVYVILDKNLISEYYMLVDYDRDSLGNNIPHNAFTSVTGFTCGTNWRPSTVNIYRVTNNKLEYSVSGIVEWRLLGLCVYSQFKSYNGFAYTKS